MLLYSDLWRSALLTCAFGHSGAKYDMMLVTTVLLVSKVVILNVLCPTGPSQEDVLGTLSVMIDAAKQVSSKEQRQNIFGHLHIMLRDCDKSEADCYKKIFGLENSDAKSAKDRDEIRNLIMDAFESKPKVWVCALGGLGALVHSLPPDPLPSRNAALPQHCLSVCPRSPSRAGQCLRTTARSKTQSCRSTSADRVR